jgi:hypothetical protein
MTITIGRSGKNYQERKGPELRNTRRGPGFMWSPTQNATHSLPLDAPLPLPDLLHDDPSQSAPEGQLTKPWPHGQTEV